MNIYQIDLDTTDTSVRNQLLLEAEVKFAIITDHTHILDTYGRLFAITEEDGEIVLTEADTEDTEDAEDADEETEPDHDIPELINLVIRNSLLSSEPIRKEQAETMLILAHLKATLSSI